MRGDKELINLWKFLEKQGLYPAAITVWFDSDRFGCSVRLIINPLWFWEI
jgi:hypothetical protein